VLGASFIFESVSLVIAFRQFHRERGGKGFWHTLTTSKNPPTYTVLAEDSADILGLILAAMGVWLGQRLDSPYPDAVASILIGLMLAGIAVFLVVQSRALLLGESTTPEVLDAICCLARREPAVERVRRPLTMHFGPENVLLVMDIQFKPRLSTAELMAAIDQVEARIREAFPQIKQIYIEVESLKEGQPRTEDMHEPRRAA
jgi:divalent metal cation (Fe/Co/Zn/Cd) transporter